MVVIVAFNFALILGIVLYLFPATSAAEPEAAKTDNLLAVPNHPVAIAQQPG